MTKTPIGYPEGGKKYKADLGTVGQDPRANIITNDFVPGQKIDKKQKWLCRMHGLCMQSVWREVRNLTRANF